MNVSNNTLTTTNNRMSNLCHIQYSEVNARMILHNIIWEITATVACEM